MPALKTLKATVTRRGLAKLLGFQLSAFAYILFQQRTAPRYRIFEIPKRRGGTRTIKAPDDALKLLQRRLADLLQDCVAEINEAQNRKDRIAHGFKRDRSINTNARQHRKRRFVFNIDLEEFFPSINFGRVRGYFISDRNFSLHPDTATLIAQIACYERELPQGSPCSPVISNLIAHILDIQLASSCREGRMYLLPICRRLDVFNEQKGLSRRDCDAISSFAACLGSRLGVSEACNSFRIPDKRCENADAISNFTAGSHRPCCEPEN